MYQLIKDIINFTWPTQGSTTEQQIIYTCCCIIICVLTFTVIDLIYRLIASIIHRGR